MHFWPLVTLCFNNLQLIDKSSINSRRQLHFWPLWEQTQWIFFPAKLACRVSGTRRVNKDGVTKKKSQEIKVYNKFKHLSNISVSVTAITKSMWKNCFFTVVTDIHIFRNYIKHSSKNDSCCYKKQLLAELSNNDCLRRLLDYLYDFFSSSVFIFS